jgi:hypothetical protein
MCIHISEGGGGEWRWIAAVIYKQYVTLKVRLNDKVAGPSQPGQKQRMIALLCAALK